MASLKDSLRQLKDALKRAERDYGGEGAHDGVISKHTRHTEESLESTRQLLERDPKNREMLDWYAFMLYTNERFEEALAIYKRLLGQDGSSIEHLYYYGCCAYRIGRIEDAMSKWSDAVKREPMSTYGQKSREKLDHVYERDFGDEKR